ncbi:VOC family protein [Pseudoxanthomonas indica]|uniref:Glyoxalase/Bleomycin resistance protein/Dioxygenase superfamily protein n=1 Tax=Pseudoxanthomonas indica TaxID=428993 RepID=A0A1T5KNB2_9GAMM|nr:VOC family protein [Pseudoxanthomonas indica]GGD50384.1 hypothetical protein GCM10007235_23090 [Pseudoxanthomonas indica]SKC65153.1 Glyoxalase/Bleomycin resistance protein/Dioxygenase superfamily protein [Pseudoxanthomonas indica]
MTAGLRNLVPFVHVQDVARSIAFYEKLGFVLQKTHAEPGTTQPIWAWLEGGHGQLMLGQSSGPIDAGQQAVLFYLYFEDVKATHAELAAAGLPVGPLRFPFYCPQGEFRLHDPDDYVLLLAHS